MTNEHITQTRLAVVGLVWQVETTIQVLEQLPQGPAPDEATADELRDLLEFRQKSVDQAISALQGRLAGATNLALLLAEGP